MAHAVYEQKIPVMLQAAVRLAYTFVVPVSCARFRSAGQQAELRLNVIEAYSLAQDLTAP
jgi:hypothetical protein